MIVGKAHARWWHVVATVDSRGLHDLACRKSSPHCIRYSQFNDLISIAVKKAQIPAGKERSDRLVNTGRKETARSNTGTFVTWQPVHLDFSFSSHWQYFGQQNNEIRRPCCYAPCSSSPSPSKRVTLVFKICRIHREAWQTHLHDHQRTSGLRRQYTCSKGYYYHWPYREAKQSTSATHSPILIFSLGRFNFDGKKQCNQISSQRASCWRETLKK